MEIAERAQALGQKIRKFKDEIKTEEATKNAFVMPFISTVLGYDVFDPAEVIPEFTADVGTKRGEKIDYALVNNGQVQVLIEAKKIHDQLTIENASQLYRYFSVTNARIAVLTNGQIYQFYTDLDAPNIMDSKPFLVFDFCDIDSTLLPELAKLTKDTFDLDSILSAAGELKYIGHIKRILATQFRQPEDDWVRFFTTRVYDGFFTQRVRDQFATLVETAARQFLNEQVNDRLQSAISEPRPIPDASDVLSSHDKVDDRAKFDSTGGTGDEETSDAIVTTEEELEGFRVVRAIVCSEVAASRVYHRDNKSYFCVMLDDNNRKPIARLWFNRSKKYLGILDERKNETRIPITCVEDIYNHADELRAAVKRYLPAAEKRVSGVESVAAVIPVPTLVKDQGEGRSSGSIRLA